ncbi:MAG TPA: family 1 glycosylhydrolase, partial [Longimicrobiaceae bacterium]
MECTVNRVGDRYFDQVERTGHDRRPADLELVAATGIAALRYPVLWERTAPGRLADADWRWPDERLGRLRELGIRPIVTLVHHGGGPPHTSLVDPSFATGLAEFARAVAERYPWVRDFTPVNEPVTTARFGGLYGHWHPHGRCARTFARAVVTQCAAVAAAMRAIREVTPDARLVHTDDAGRTFATRSLAYQAAFENERRWLAVDLLCGRVGPAHPLRRDLLEWGIAEGELDAFLAAPAPPDVLGVNYYLTSDRLLDRRRRRYPARAHGGNAWHRYADVEAVRAWGGGIAGHAAVLREAWERYRIPVAVTELHLGCTREEQMRWLREAWDAAGAARGEGVDVRAVTVWSLLGCYDWDSLATRDGGRYEPGAFDLRAPAPRPTALAAMMRELAAGRAPAHPVLDTPGWWRRPERYGYPRVGPERAAGCDGGRGAAPARPLLIAGAGGTLGSAFAHVCGARGLAHVALGRGEMDVADSASVAAAMERHRPWAVVNAAGYVRADDAEREPERCWRENVCGAAVLAAACARGGAALLTFSSDLVFGGCRDRPRVESGAPRPLSVYGRSKAVAEERVLATLPSALVVRTGPCFGPRDEHDFVTVAVRTI